MSLACDEQVSEWLSCQHGRVGGRGIYPPNVLLMRGVKTNDRNRILWDLGNRKCYKFDDNRASPVREDDIKTSAAYRQLPLQQQETTVKYREGFAVQFLGGLMSERKILSPSVLSYDSFSSSLPDRTLYRSTYNFGRRTATR
ncbi:hypothetical protein OIU76_021171 [Salix suchowensis]|nr:hypothetical protein OIU76_021171 [Salix suchowensis]